MKFLLILTCADGQVFSCGPTCYNGTGSRDDCVCGGHNRNVGQQIAARNVHACFKAMTQAWQAKHPEREIVAVDITGAIPNRTRKWYD